MATPIDQALALANAGQPVPEALQIQVFQFAGANNMAATDLERIFNVPAGSAAATTQALGIADQVPLSLGGNVAPSGIASQVPTGVPDIKLRDFVENPGAYNFPEDRASDLSPIDSSDRMGGGIGIGG